MKISHGDFVRKSESEHMGPDNRFMYKGRFLICLECKARFRMRHNGTLRMVTPNGGRK